MSDGADLGVFAAGFASWARVLSHSADDAVRLVNFGHCCTDFATYVSKGLELPDAVDALLSLAQSHGLVDQVGLESIEATIAKAFEPGAAVKDKPKVNGSGNGAGYEEPPAPQPQPLPWINMSSWDTDVAPVRQWSILNRAPANQAGLFSGEGGTGKSIIELMKNVAHVAGKDWLGSMPEMGPAFYVGAEDDVDEIHRRLAAIAAHYDVTFKQLVDSGLYIMCLLGQDATLCAVTNKSGKVETTALYKLLYQAAGDIKPKNISIDTLSRAFVGNEIDRTQVYGFNTHMQALAMVTGGGCVTILSHPSLTGIASGSGISGSTGWHGAFRFRHYLTSSKSADDDADDDLRELQFKKNQYGPKGEAIVLRYQNGLFLPPDSPSSLEKLAREARVDDLYLTFLRRFNERGRNLSDKPKGNDYAPRLFIEEPEARLQRIRQTEMEEAMQRLFAKKRIRMEQYGRPSRPYFRMIEV